MRSIPFMNDWKTKEIQDLEPFCKEVRYELRDTVICKEGQDSEKIIVVVKGELEVVKKDLSTCYFNAKTGVVGVKENKPNGILVKSNNML